MIKQHDYWSKMGEENLGKHNIEWAKKMEDFHMGVPGHGPMTLMKAILNDHWADCPAKDSLLWNGEYINMVMSKLYWCWVAWLDCAHMEVGEEE